MKWVYLETFNYSRLKASWSRVSGVDVLHLKHEWRPSRTQPWVHKGDDYVVQGAKDFTCQSEAEIPAMVDRFLNSKPAK